MDERDDGNRRQELLSAAAHLFRRKGFDATSTRDIAAAVGMQSGSPFYHFKSKDALLYAVMETGMHSAIARQQQALQQIPPQPSRVALRRAAGAGPRAVAQLRLLVRNHFDVLLGPGSDFIPVMLYEARALAPRQRAALAKLQTDYESVWMPVLEALHGSGLLKGSPKWSRLFILGALNWSVQWFDRKQEASLEDLTDAALALFVQTPP
jgi:AcrR family transcriptional regulator